jgi:hypothetical protein
VPGGTTVTDADTGERIRNVRRVSFEHDARNVPTITLEILCHHGVEVELEGVATFGKLEIPEEGSSTVSNVFVSHVLKGTEG